MHFELSQTFIFEAAHTIERAIDAESSRRIHGHTYTAEVTIVGQKDPAKAMLVDLGVLRSALERVRERLDHRHLNDIDGLGAPTLENLCAFIAAELQSDKLKLAHVQVGRAATGDSCRLVMNSSVERR